MIVTVERCLGHKVGLMAVVAWFGPLTVNR
jgi:hypothetical protein